jgi:hypothetical protein
VVAVVEEPPVVDVPAAAEPEPDSQATFHVDPEPSPTAHEAKQEQSPVAAESPSGPVYGAAIAGASHRQSVSLIDFAGQFQLWIVCSRLIPVLRMGMHAGHSEQHLAQQPPLVELTEAELEKQRLKQEKDKGATPPSSSLIQTFLRACDGVR